MPNRQPRPTRSGGSGIGIIIAIIVIVVVGWAWGYGGYGWGTWWNKNTSNHAANTTPNSGAPGAASNVTQQPQDRQAQQSQDQQPQAQHPNNQQGQRSNINQAAQNPSNTNQAAQNPGNTNQPAQNPSNTNHAAQNQPNNEQTISPNSLLRNEVRQVQQALEKNGFRAGPVDGRWGPKTSDAVKHFQQSKNIQANGQLDQQTLSDLGLNGAQFASQNQNNSSQTGNH